MSKVRVYEVARQLNMDQKTLVALFQSMGIGDVRNHMSAVESDAVERVKRHLERQKQPEVVEERIRPTVVKRRARAADPARARDSSAGTRAPAPAPSAPGSSPGRAAPARASAGRGAARTADADAAASSEPASTTPATAPVRRKAPAAAKSVDEMPAPKPSRPEIPPARTSSPGIEAMEAVPPVPPPTVEPSQPDPQPPAPPATKAKASGAKKEAAKAPAASAPEPAPAAETSPASPAPEPAATASSPAPSDSAPASTRGTEVAAAPEAPKRVAPQPNQPVTPSEPPRRPSTPPRTGIDVWQGRPGVPMPAPRTSPPARRTTYDPRASSAPARPGTTYGPGGRSFGGARGRPGFRRPGGPSMPRRPVQVSTLEMSSHKKVIKIEEQVTLQQIAAKMSLKATDVLMRLLSMGTSGVNINSTLDAETAKILANEFGWSVEDVAVSEEETLEAAMGIEAVSDEEAEPRPPIVTVMGHVDHGKTSLLDKIRKSTVASGEAGGITQHIGAYRVETSHGTVAFLDTPGHEAFTAMRMRGASVTDIVILVVAADDGIMPQTKEAISHAQSAKVPIIVAINKIDKEGADVEKVKRDLASAGLQPEDWGGDTMTVAVSAHTGEGIDQLLEGVLLQAEVLELRAQPKRKASGVVIEALLDRGRGPVARVMIQDGTIQAGDIVLAGAAWGKVRAMTDEKGRPTQSAGPSTPVEVLGLNEVPSAGDPVHVVKDLKTAEEIAETRRKKASKTLIPQDSRVSLEALTSRLSEADQLELKLIIKGDVQGSVEAVVSALIKLTTPKVKVTIVHAAVGAITEGDVNLAVASKAIIAGFNVRPAGKSSSLAESEGVEIRLYSIIYNAVDDVRAAMEGLLPATKVEKALGKAEVRQVFRIVKIGIVAGCMVTSGVIKRNCEARLLRDGAVVHTGKVSGLRRFKDDAKEVPEGMECGASFENYQDIKEGDIIEAYEIEMVKTKL